MSQAKHTPGPWVIGAIESGQFAVDGADGQDVTGWLNSEADARLISAAPELLDVLWKIMECPRDIDMATVSKSGIDAHPDQVVANISIGLTLIREARAVMAKAM